MQPACAVTCVASHSRPETLKLPDQLLVRYFRAGEIDDVRAVKVGADGIEVIVGKEKRVDRWRDLGGGLGFVPG